MTQRKLKIVYLLGKGYSSWAVQIAKSMHEKGHEIVIACPEDGPITRLDGDNLRSQIIHFPNRIFDVARITRSILELVRFLKAYQADVVHYFLPPVTLWGRIAAWMVAVPVRACQLSGPWHLELPLYRFLEISTAWMDTNIIASSRALQEIYLRYPHTRNKVSLSYFGTLLAPFDAALPSSPVRAELGLDCDQPVVGLIAYMYPPIKHFNATLGIKGHEIFLQAAREIAGADSRVKFLIVGDEPLVDGRPVWGGAYRAKLEQMAADLGLTGRVIFTGHRSDVARMLAAVDVVAVPSLSENVGGAIEPLLMEKPVVASQVGGLPDVVIDGETGFLVPPRDSHRLAQALLQVLALPNEQRQWMGRRGREIVTNLFDLDKTTAQLETLYYARLSHIRPTTI